MLTCHAHCDSSNNELLAKYHGWKFLGFFGKKFLGFSDHEERHADVKNHD